MVRVLLKSFTDRFKNILEPTAEELITEENKEIREEKQMLKEAEKKLKEAEKFALEREKEANEVQILRDPIEQTQARIDALEKEHDSNLENHKQDR